VAGSFDSKLLMEPIGSISSVECSELHEGQTMGVYHIDHGFDVPARQTAKGIAFADNGAHFDGYGVGDVCELLCFEAYRLSPNDLT